LQEQVGSFPFTLDILLQKACSCRFLFICLKMDTNISLHAATRIAALLLNQFVYVMFFCSYDCKLVHHSHIDMR
jgi:hypothetical protein